VWGGVAITNQGTISASGGTLNIQPSAAGLTNTGLIQALSGSTMFLLSGVPLTYNNTGGTIKALDNSTIWVEANISGGTITTAGSGNFTLSPPGAGAGLQSLTNAGTFNVPSGAGLNWTGVINNTGIFNLNGSISTNGTVTLQGSGAVLMNNGAFDGINANPLINQQLIHGAGKFYQVPLTNQATIQADNTSAFLYIDGSSTTNTATLQATGGGTLQLDTVVNNSGGTIEAQNGSTVIFTNNFNGSINGGTLTTVGTGTIQSQNGVLNGTVNIPTNAGTLDVSGGFALFLQGTINNTGTIAVTGNSCVELNQASTLTGSGVLTMGPNACIFGSGLAFTNQSTIEGAGTIGDSNPMPITNTGTIIANQPSTLFITPNATGFTNTGTLIVNTGSTLDITGLLTNLVKGTLSKGTYSVAGVLDIQSKITTNASNITLSGSGAQIFDAFDGVNALAGLIQNTGTLILQNGQALATTTNVTNKGTISVGTGSSFTTGGNYTQAAKTTTVDGTLSAPTGLTVKKGTLQGQGTLVAAVASSGTVIAGDSSTKSGVLTVNGSYTQNPTGVLDVAINGTQVGTQYSQVAVSNGVSLNGTLNLKRLKKFIPVVGATFTILTGSAITSQFVTVNGLSINSNEHFQIAYNPTNVTLTVFSGP
jgi:hypothetical protein